MEKNWLIRTQTHKILGPVSKAKILELVQKRSLADEDEVCPGNGHWFFIREKELVEQYLFGDLPSRFNPVSEAPKNISGHDENWIDAFLKQMEGGKPASRKAPQNSPAADVTLVKNLNDIKKDLAQLDEIPDEDLSEDSIQIPDSSDLEYPDMGDIQVDAPQIETMSVSSKKPSNEGVVVASNNEVDDEEDIVKIPEDSDLEYPDMGMETVEESDEIIPPLVAATVEEPPKAPPVEEKRKGVPLPPKNSPKKAPIVKNLSVTSPPSANKVTPVKTEPVLEMELEQPKSQVQIQRNDGKPVAALAQNKDIDPMLLLQLANGGQKSSSTTTKRNDHFLVIAFVVILGVIGFLFYQYKQMIKKTVNNKPLVVKEKVVQPLVTPQASIEPTTTTTTEAESTPAALEEEQPTPLAPPQE